MIDMLLDLLSETRLELKKARETLEVYRERIQLEDLTTLSENARLRAQVELRDAQFAATAKDARELRARRALTEWELADSYNRSCSLDLYGEVLKVRNDESADLAYNFTISQSNAADAYIAAAVALGLIEAV